MAPLLHIALQMVSDDQCQFYRCALYLGHPTNFTALLKASCFTFVPWSLYFKLSRSPSLPAVIARTEMTSASFSLLLSSYVVFRVS